MAEYCWILGNVWSPNIYIDSVITANSHMGGWLDLRMGHHGCVSPQALPCCGASLLLLFPPPSSSSLPLHSSSTSAFPHAVSSPWHHLFLLFLVPPLCLYLYSWCGCASGPVCLSLKWLKGMQEQAQTFPPRVCSHTHVVMLLHKYMRWGQFSERLCGVVCVSTHVNNVDMHTVHECVWMGVMHAG